MAHGCRNRARYTFLCGAEPLRHQTGPHQTVRAENWWNQLLVRFRVFAFQEIQNHLDAIQNIREVLRQGPLPGMHYTEVRSGDG